MKCKCLKNEDTIERVQHCLDVTMSINLDELERLVQQSHEYDHRSMDKPPEIFAVSRQALRMLWKFRLNLDAANIQPESDINV